MAKRGGWNNNEASPDERRGELSPDRDDGAGCGDWNVARDLDKLRQMTQSPGVPPSRWVRQMAAEIIRLREKEGEPPHCPTCSCGVPSEPPHG